MKKIILLLVLLILMIFGCKKKVEDKKLKDQVKVDDSQLIMENIKGYMDSVMNADKEGISKYTDKNYILRIYNKNKRIDLKLNDFLSNVQKKKNTNDFKINILNIYKNIASASIVTELEKRYIHLAKLNNEWKIINEIIENNSKKNITDKDIEAIKQAGVDYVEGFFSSKERIAKVLHKKLTKRTPEFSSVTNVNYDQMIVFAKNQELPNNLNFNSEIYDVNDNIATIFVKSKYVDYCHLIKEDNQWKIINVLWVYK